MSGKEVDVKKQDLYYKLASAVGNLEDKRRRIDDLKEKIKYHRW